MVMVSDLEIYELAFYLIAYSIQYVEIPALNNVVASDMNEF